MATRAVGIDFGTSNTAMAAMMGGAPSLLPVEGEAVSIPSAVFFNFETHAREFGRRAIQSYVDGHDGRFMRALKSILGTSLMGEHTYVRGVRTTYSDIIASFLTHLRVGAGARLGEEPRAVVAGRPVAFVDGDEAADQAAEDALGAIYRDAGFEEVAFQFEPIAAALDYERQVGAEKVVLIADLGGGTSDFSVVRVSPERAKAQDRSGDILATGGVHIGGTDLDRLISLDRVMPRLGLGSSLRRDFAAGTLTVPRHIYHSLSTWQQIHRLYDRAVLREVADYKRLAVNPERIERLQRVLAERLGHRLILSIEDGKIALTDTARAAIDLGEVERGLAVALDVEAFEALIAASTEAIAGALRRCVAEAGLAPEAIAAVFFTGGTAAIPSVRAALLAEVPHAEVVDGDRFGSVGTGLALEAARTFG